MVINIAVCDNDQIIHTLLNEYFLRFKPNSNISCDVSYFSNGFELLKSYSNGNYYHLIILDIEMPELSGVETASRIQEEYDYNALFVYLTSYPEHMHGNFIVQPCQYWLKPLAFADFKENLSHLITKANAISQSIMFTSISRKNISLRLQSIIYIEIHTTASSIVFHTLNSHYRADTKHVTSLELINDFPFVSATENIIINLRHIKSFHIRNVELSNGTIIKLNAVKVNELKKIFFNYMMST